MTGRLVVTGSAGFIGRHVVEEAVRRGYRVTGIDRREMHADGFEFVNVDIRDRDRMREVMRGADCVVHLAAVTSNVEFGKNCGECYDTNVAGFQVAIEAAARGDCSRFLYASSAAVYQDGFSEDALLDVRTQDNHYAKTKMINEMTAKSYHDTRDMKTTGLRYFNVYGSGENDKGDYASIISIFLRSWQRREPLVVYGDGTQARDLVNVRDAARLTLDVMERGSGLIYNIGTGVATSYRDIARMIDRDAIRYVANPLSSYQHYTRAQTERLMKAVGPYEFIQLEAGIGAMRKC